MYELTVYNDLIINADVKQQRTQKICQVMRAHKAILSYCLCCNLANLNTANELQADLCYYYLAALQWSLTQRSFIILFVQINSVIRKNVL